MNSFSHRENPKITNDELGRKSVSEFKAGEKSSVVVVLDNVRSLHNVGSVFRTTDAFAIKELLLCGITGTPPHREINKTALGATDSVDWKYIEQTEDAIQQLKKDGFKIYAIEQTKNSISLDQFSPPQSKIALIFGHEVKGVQQKVIDLCDDSIEIPQMGTKHSFNVSVSAGIVLWDIITKSKQLRS